MCQYIYQKSLCTKHQQQHTVTKSGRKCSWAQQDNTKASFADDKVVNSSSHLMMHLLQRKPSPTAKMRMINTLALVRGLQGNETSCRSLHYTCQHKLISRQLKAMHQHSNWPYSITRHHKHAIGDLIGWFHTSRKKRSTNKTSSNVSYRTFRTPCEENQARCQ